MANASVTCVLQRRRVDKMVAAVGIGTAADRMAVPHRQTMARSATTDLVRR